MRALRCRSKASKTSAPSIGHITNERVVVRAVESTTIRVSTSGRTGPSIRRNVAYTAEPRRSPCLRHRVGEFRRKHFQLTSRLVANYFWRRRARSVRRSHRFPGPLILLLLYTTGDVSAEQSAMDLKEHQSTRDVAVQQPHRQQPPGRPAGHL